MLIWTEAGSRWRNGARILLLLSSVLDSGCSKQSHELLRIRSQRSRSSANRNPLSRAIRSINDPNTPFVSAVVRHSPQRSYVEVLLVLPRQRDRRPCPVLVAERPVAVGARRAALAALAALAASGCDEFDVYLGEEAGLGGEGGEGGEGGTAGADGCWALGNQDWARAPIALPREDEEHLYV